jgi:CTP:molybdopterin cytidylyltransferase MocA
MMKNLSAIIVAARSGRRLRTPIPMLPFGDTTVLGRTLRAYLDAKFSEIIVVLGYRGEEIRASLGDLGSKVVTVQAPNGDEPYADLLRLGAERLSASAKVFAIGRGDQPLLGKEILEVLGAAYAATKGKILVPTWQGLVGHPVFFDVAFAADFRDLAAPAETWDIIKAHAEQVEDREVQYTAVVQGIEDRDDYFDALRCAGLPVPEPAPREEPAGVIGNGFPEAGPVGSVSFGG